MPQADLTVVGERGWTLSGGQKIRLNSGQVNVYNQYEKHYIISIGFSV